MRSKVRLLSIAVIIVALCTRALLSSELALGERLLRAAIACTAAIALYGALLYVVDRYLPELSRGRTTPESERRPGRLKTAAARTAAYTGRRVNITVEAEARPSADRLRADTRSAAHHATAQTERATAVADGLNHNAAWVARQDPQQIAGMLRSVVASSRPSRVRKRVSTSG